MSFEGGFAPKFNANKTITQRRGAWCLYGETRHITSGMVFSVKVGNSIQTSEGLLLMTLSASLNLK